MLRGIVEDITISAPVLFTAYLEELPWTVGCASHFTIAATPYGLIWLASDNTVQLYNGVSKPEDISGAIYPILRNITAGQAKNARGVFFNYVEREWYALAIAYNGATVNNLVLIFDLDPDPATNAGVFILDVGVVEAIGILEDANAGRMLCIAQKGKLLQVKMLSEATSGIAETVTSTSNTLPAYYRTGYFGADAPQETKMFRWGRIVTDQGGFAVKALLTDDEGRPVRYPEVLDLGVVDGSKYVVNRKARRMALEITFPSTDVSANLLELSNMYIPVGDR